jgi:undecaprenyl-diphosphatase
MAKIKRLNQQILYWLLQETQDLSERLRAYPKTRFWLLGFLALNSAAFLLLLWLKINSPLIEELDLWLKIDYALGRFSQAKVFFEIITFLGSGYVVVLVCLGVFFWLFRHRRRRAASILVLLLAISSFLGAFLKSFFDRPRPFTCLPNTISNGCLSFPSGHALTAVYFYGLVAFLVFRFGFWRLRSYLPFAVALFCLIFLIGFSRVALGAHYLSDVIGGFLLGMAFLWLAILLVDVFYHEKK